MVKLDRFSFSSIIGEADMTDEVKSELLLINQVTMPGESNLKAQKGTKVSEILYLKLLLKKLFQWNNSLLIITSKDHVINTDEENGTTTSWAVSEESIVVKILCEANS